MPVTTDHAVQAQAEHHDVSVYAVRDLGLTLPDEQLPLTLTCNAVTHEVRSHGVAVIWSIERADPLLLEEIGYPAAHGALPAIIPNRSGPAAVCRYGRGRL